MTDTHTFNVCDTCKYHIELNKLCYSCFDDKGYRTNWENENKTYTNYERYFGTPEKAAMTMANGNALVFGKYQSLEWLNTEVSE